MDNRLDSVIDTLTSINFNDIEYTYKGGIHKLTIENTKTWQNKSLDQLCYEINDDIRNTSHKLTVTWYNKMISNFEKLHPEYIPSYRELYESGSLFTKFIIIHDVLKPNVNQTAYKIYDYDLDEKIDYSIFAYIAAIEPTDDKILVKGISHADLLLEKV